MSSVVSLSWTFLWLAFCKGCFGWFASENWRRFSRSLLVGIMLLEVGCWEGCVSKISKRNSVADIFTNSILRSRPFTFRSSTSLCIYIYTNHYAYLIGTMTMNCIVAFRFDVSKNHRASQRLLQEVTRRLNWDGILNVRGEIKSERGASEEEEGDEQRRKEEEEGGGGGAPQRCYPDGKWRTLLKPWI